MWKLEIVEPVRDWLRSLRKDDPELGQQIAARIELLLDGPGRHPRELVASLAGDQARRISLLLLARDDKRNVKSSRFYSQLIDEAEARFERWLADSNEEST